MSLKQVCADISWHYIGQIQSNKTRIIAEYFDWVHSVDRLKIAQRLSQQRTAKQPPLNICLQINIDAEVQKAGVLPDAAATLVQQIQSLPRLKLRGLMIIPQTGPADYQQNTHTAQQNPFARTQALFTHLNQLLPAAKQMDTLSMGMSADLEAAIAHGATFVRVGTALFGARD